MASEQETLPGYFRKFIGNFEKRVGINRAAKSLGGYRNAYDHVERFIRSQYKVSDVPFTTLDLSFIEKYDLHLRTECRLAPGTGINLTIRLKTVVGEAIADDIITSYPFFGHEPVHPKQERKYLTDEELHRIMSTPLHSPSLFLVRDMFLFSCHTGIPYGDMRLLTAANLSKTSDGAWRIKGVRERQGWSSRYRCWSCRCGLFENTAILHLKADCCRCTPTVRWTCILTHSAYLRDKPQARLPRRKT